jgi:hypothetical protein
MKFDTNIMIGSHGPVVHGNEEISDIFVHYHDAMKYVHDQTIQQMENLLNIDDIVLGEKLGCEYSIILTSSDLTSSHPLQGSKRCKKTSSQTYFSNAS